MLCNDWYKAANKEDTCIVAMGTRLRSVTFNNVREEKTNMIVKGLTKLVGGDGGQQISM